jgi:purine nucleosidase
MNNERIIPQIPPKGELIHLIIDSDVANEIDDLYALTIAFYHPERFHIEGIVATHFATGGAGGKQMSYDVLQTLMEKAGKQGICPTFIGSDPMQYIDTYNDSEGVDFIIETARKYSEDNPLWVVAIGAATNLACAVMKAPDIIPKVRFVFHSRCPQFWPERSDQYNVYGDIIAAQTLLQKNVPLIWFDTGADICADYAVTKELLEPLGEIGKWLHQYRDNRDDFMRADKGFFDMGDFAYLYDPSCARSEVVDAPEMTRNMYFNHNHNLGKMVRVYDIDADAVWKLFYDGIKNNI